MAKSRQPRLASLAFAVFTVAGLITLGGVVGAVLIGRWADIDRGMPYVLVYLALVIAIDARWLRAERDGPPRADDREGPSVQGDTH